MPINQHADGNTGQRNHNFHEFRGNSISPADGVQEPAAE